VAIGSGADFSAQSANPSNTFTAGSLTIDNSREGAAIFSPSDMTPGAPARTGTVDIENSGSIAGTFTLSRDRLASTDSGDPNPWPFASRVNLTVVDCGAFAGATAPTCGDGDDVTQYSGTVAGMTGSTALGTFAGGEKHRYKFSVALDSSAGNAYQGGSSSVEFDWNAAS
jgi:hypothetical protein